MTRIQKTKNADDDTVPLNLDAFWRTMNRRLADFEGRSAGCASARCRRAKRCADARLLCVPEGPTSPMTEEQSAEVRASLRTALDDERLRRGLVR